MNKKQSHATKGTVGIARLFAQVVGSRKALEKQAEHFQVAKRQVVVEMTEESIIAATADENGKTDRFLDPFELVLNNELPLVMDLRITLRGKEVPFEEVMTFLDRAAAKSVEAREKLDSIYVGKGGREYRMADTVPDGHPYHTHYSLERELGMKLEKMGVSPREAIRAYQKR